MDWEVLGVCPATFTDKSSLQTAVQEYNDDAAAATNTHGPIEGWDGELGWVDEAKFVKYAAPPSEDTLVMVCGLPGLYDAFCGPRTEAGVQKRTILHKLGYTAEMVAKF